MHLAESRAPDCLAEHDLTVCHFRYYFHLQRSTLSMGLHAACMLTIYCVYLTPRLEAGQQPMAPVAICAGCCSALSGVVAAERQAGPGKEEEADDEERREADLAPLADVLQVEEG